MIIETGSTSKSVRFSVDEDKEYQEDEPEGHSQSQNCHRSLNQPEICDISSLMASQFLNFFYQNFLHTIFYEILQVAILMIIQGRKNQTMKTPRIVKKLIKRRIHNRQNLEGHYPLALLLDCPLDYYKHHQ